VLWPACLDRARCGEAGGGADFKGFCALLVRRGDSLMIVVFGSDWILVQEYITLQSIKLRFVITFFGRLSKLFSLCKTIHALSWLGQLQKSFA
jgi:hypothetical protein